MDDGPYYFMPQQVKTALGNAAYWSMALEDRLNLEWPAMNALLDNTRTYGEIVQYNEEDAREGRWGEEYRKSMLALKCREQRHLWAELGNRVSSLFDVLSDEEMQRGGRSSEMEVRRMTDSNARMWYDYMRSSGGHY